MKGFIVDKNKKEKSAAHKRLQKALAPAYLREVYGILEDVNLDAVGKAKALYALETDLWDLLGE